MRREINMIRRKWIITLASSPIISLVTSAKGAFNSYYQHAEFISEILKNRADAEYIGLLYLNDNPQEASMKKLITTLFETDPTLEKLIKKNSTEAYNHLKIMQKTDFKNEYLVNVDGWILSRTEARLCAITTFI